MNDAGTDTGLDMGGIDDAATDAPSSPDASDSGGGGMPGTCQPNGTGGTICLGGWCPYDCCGADGHVATCTLPPGSECNVVPVTHCGGDLCAPVGMTCGDAGFVDDGGVADGG